MNRFVADLHIHSRYSRATSKALTPRRLAAWARVKGIDVLGTGDFTHPQWLAELEENLREDGSGLYSLREESGLAAEIPWLPRDPAGRTRFLLQAEISSIYKKAGKVRKVHNLVFVPDFATARKLNAKLERVGNLASDGRPILGLDSHDLLDMVLSLDPRAFLVPAHIWTPWFSVFGSKSGFDSLEECYGDLSSHVFAAETGLSSDPAMNWTWSKLDRLKLLSNSDAHSGEKLGREANLFSGDISYEGILRALKDEGLSHKFLGTIEFFPEEGKYHLDGHRKCNVVLEPEESRKRGGLCPACGKPLTLGVLSRVLELADRDEPVKPAHAPGFTSLIPLTEILSEVLGCGVTAKPVIEAYARLMDRHGSELAVLGEVPPEDLARTNPLLGEAVARMRSGRVIRRPGYDGEYGVIRVFSGQERKEFASGRAMVGLAVDRDQPGSPVVLKTTTRPEPQAPEPRPEFNAAQKAAVEADPGPVLVLAGPGTGKTRTLIGRVERLLDAGADPESVLVVTFTRRAASELRERLAALRGDQARLPHADTLHACAYAYWTMAHNGHPPVLMNENTARSLFAEANPELSGSRLKKVFSSYILDREGLRQSPQWRPGGEYDGHVYRYARLKEGSGVTDHTDLLEFWLEGLRKGRVAARPEQVLVDEVQDLTALQMAIILALSHHDGRGLFLIGDPDQSIYGFRGAAGGVQESLRRRWPRLSTLTLTENYRSGQGVLDLARALLPAGPKLTARPGSEAAITLFQAPDESHEATWVADKIRGLIGATSHTLAGLGDEGEYSPGQIAVLVRFKALIAPLEKSLTRLGLPVSVPEQEAFWADLRIQTLLRSVGKSLGLPVGEGEVADLPPKVLDMGPVGLSAWLNTIPPFDELFWRGKEFVALKKAYAEHGDWPALISHVQMQDELELVGSKAEKVRIMSLHAAKGLEFEAVFLPALEEGILPFAGTSLLTGKPDPLEERPDEAEERRLLYVGLTRARRRLYLSSGGKRRLFGRMQILPPSRFLKGLPEELFTRVALVPKKVTKEKSLTLFE
jgi:uncharacterized protein (TIGR00375 family)